MTKTLKYLDKVLEILFLFLIFFTPVSTALSNIFIGLLFILYLLKIILSKNYKFPTSDLNIYIFMFFLLSLLSILKADSIELSLSRIVSPIFKYMVFYFIAYDLINKENIKKYCKIIMVSGIFAFSYGFYIDYFTAENFFNHNNSNGTFAAFITIFLLTYILYKNNSLLKKLFLGIGILAGFFLVTSYSRGASLAFFIALTIWLAMYFIKHKNIKYMLIILVVLIVVSYFAIPNELINRFKELENIEENNSLQTRVIMWKASLLIIKDNPILGVGIGNFNSNFLYYLDNVLKDDILKQGRLHYHPHNLYLYIASEQGIISLIIYLIALIKLYIISYRNYKSSNNSISFILGLSLIGVLSVISTHSMVDTTIRHNQIGFYVIIFIILNLKLYNHEIKE